MRRAGRQYRTDAVVSLGGGDAAGPSACRHPAIAGADTWSPPVAAIRRLGDPPPRPRRCPAARPPGRARGGAGEAVRRAMVPVVAPRRLRGSRAADDRATLPPSIMPSRRPIRAARPAVVTRRRSHRASRAPPPSRGAHHAPARRRMRRDDVSARDRGGAGRRRGGFDDLATALHGDGASPPTPASTRIGARRFERVRACASARRSPRGAFDAASTKKFSTAVEAVRAPSCARGEASAHGAATPPRRCTVRIVRVSYCDGTRVFLILTENRRSVRRRAGAATRGPRRNERARVSSAADGSATLTSC